MAMKYSTALSTTTFTLFPAGCSRPFTLQTGVVLRPAEEPEAFPAKPYLQRTANPTKPDPEYARSENFDRVFTVSCDFLVHPMTIASLTETKHVSGSLKASREKIFPAHPFVPSTGTPGFGWLEVLFPNHFNSRGSRRPRKGHRT